jgi:hypothetical protein
MNSINNNSIIYKSFHSDGTHVTLEHLIIAGFPGSGKTTWGKLTISQEPTKRHIIYCSNHDLCYEWVHDIKENKMEVVHFCGFVKGCDACVDVKTNELGTYMTKRNVQGGVICQHLINSGLCPHSGERKNCGYHDMIKKVQEKYVKDDDGEYKLDADGNKIPISVVTVPHLAGAINIKDFDGQRIVDEDCADVEIPIVYDIEDIKRQLRILLTTHIPNDKHKFTIKNYNEAVKTFETMNVTQMYFMKEHLTRHIYKTNKYNIEKVRGDIKEICDKMVTLRIDSLIMAAEFITHYGIVEYDNVKFNWICKCEDVAMYISQINEQINDDISKIQYHDKNGWNVYPTRLGLFENIEGLEHYAANEFKKLLTHAKIKKIDITSLGYQEVFEQDLKVADMVEFLKKASTMYRRRKIPDKDLKSSYTFQEVLFYQHLKCDKQQLIINNAKNVDSITYLDTTIISKMELFLIRLKEFQKLFPSYNVNCKMRELERDMIKPVLIIPKTDLKFAKDWSAVNFDKHKDVFRKMIYNIKRRKGINEVLVITHLKILKQFGKQNQDGSWTLFGCHAIYRGSSPGINKYQDCDYVVVIGSFFPPRSFFEEQIAKYYPHLLDSYNFNNKISMDFDNEKRTQYPKDDLLRFLMVSIWDEDTYNMISRCRQYNKQTTIVYYGWNIPQKLIENSIILEE